MRAVFRKCGQSAPSCAPREATNENLEGVNLKTAGIRCEHYDKRNAHRPVRHRSPMRSIIRVMSALCFASLSWAAQCWFGRRGALAWSKSH